MDTHIKSLLDHLLLTTSSASVKPVSVLREDEWNQVQRYSLVIVIYFSQTCPSRMRSFLNFCSRIHGPENMIKVIIDLKDAESEERDHSEWGQSPPCFQVTLTAAELNAIGLFDDVSIGRRMADKVKEIRKILQAVTDNSQHHSRHKKPVIGIFSRAAEGQYSWLMSILGSLLNKDGIAEVRPCCISNNDLQQFYEDVSHCKFGILYHSKNRGRINVTDVLGALYDEELKALSSRYGKNNVIVVIDDLENSSDEEKCRILTHQPSIGTMAANLFLISLEEKTSNYQRYLMVKREEAEKKLQALTEAIRRMKPGPENMIKVIIDLKDAESEERDHSEWGQSPPCFQVTLTAAELNAIGLFDDVSIGRRMADKVKEIRKILQAVTDNSQHHSRHKKPVIGIFSRAAEGQYSWLMSILGSLLNKDGIAEVRPCCISNNDLQQFYEDVSHCKFGILYHSKNRGRINVTDVLGALYDEELKALSSRYGKNNVIVVIDDLENSSDEEKCRILTHQPSIGTMAANLFLISLEEKTSNYQRYLMVKIEEAEKKLPELTEAIRRMKLANAQNIEKSRDGENKKGTELVLHDKKTGGLSPLHGAKSETKEQKKSKSRKNEIRTASGAHRDVPLVDPFNKKSIGIFSRSLESEYSWLKMLLESQDFSNCVQSVRSCPVSNVFSKFCNEVTLCKFGILYHSKNRGRINVTDVTDSLYDEELEFLSSRLGKKNVVVVIDDLEDASEAMKNKLLSDQHSIEKLAQDLILVKRSSSEEKRWATRDALKKVFQ